MFKRVLIANRGEIAVRVIRACKELGLETVAVYSTADRESLHARLADRALCLGPAPSRESYLSIPAVLAAAKVGGADAVHPGYGFLSENADFAQACVDSGLAFIGPQAQAIRRLGNKNSAKALARQAGVPVVPGTKGLVQDNFLAEAQAIGFPVMIKAASGGGGRGLRMVRDPGLLEGEVRLAQNEAQAAFKDGSVYLEKLIDRPRHVEIQVAADLQGHAVAFPERDCTVQRRHQKLLEESPSPALSADTRRKMQEAALRLVREALYSNVGTVEFLLDKDGNFYFIEVNTRLQVEHPVTELVTGLDLVQTQIRLAAGEPLDIDQDRASRIMGHAIELRVNAEDSSRGFAPCPGTISALRWPGGPGVRVDSHLYAGYTVPSYYDSLIAKLLVLAPDRPQAVSRALRALSECDIQGIFTTIPFHRKVLSHPDFTSGKFDTDFINQMEEKRHGVPA